MKRKALVVLSGLFLLVGLSTNLQAQIIGAEDTGTPFVDRLVPHFGIFFEYINLEPIDASLANQGFQGNYSFTVLQGGTYIVFKHVNDVASIGLDPSLGLGLRFAGDDLSLVGQVPVFIFGRIGSGATKYNDQPFGLGAGIGAVMTHMRIRDYQSETLDFNQTFLNPAFVVEATIRTSVFSLQGRFHAALDQPIHSGVMTSGGFATSPDEGARYGNFGLGIIYSF